LPALPRPQAKALAVALLVDEAEESTPDQRAIALAFSGALRVLARSQPVAVAIDDVQWLDRPSAFVLGFALRRLRAEALAFLLTLRKDDGTLAPLDFDRVVDEQRLSRLGVGPLSPGALQRLLGAELGLVLSRPKLRRLRELSGGNPMFALERWTDSSFSNQGAQDRSRASSRAQCLRSPGPSWKWQLVLLRAQEPSYASEEGRNALGDREAVAVELERARAIHCLRPAALHPSLPAPVAFGTLLLFERGRKRVAQLALSRLAVHLAVSHRYWTDVR